MMGRSSSAAVEAVYPGVSDNQALAASFRDKTFSWFRRNSGTALVESGIEHVYRYSYGAIFADNQPLPGLGAWHTSELPELFGTYNASTATTAEKTLSNTFQTILANFIKNPKTSPAANWPEYGNGTIAILAYNGIVNADNFVQPVSSKTLDGPCDALWDAFLDYRP
ncbi:hypothetical protein BV25DRAFT_643884 [Artomyces pyxidatus]|uniref:Uncharacterized protein n=1 Tax=Artomyces pyxidatus TaxID=48021 RepID=A0ACB8T368_9AGAM|nr:hypothetical protein BV25DRAFT_643884 [Artomyces pyxidatus]